jgi:hypothetical protein
LFVRLEFFDDAAGGVDHGGEAIVRGSNDEAAVFYSTHPD